MELYRSAAGVVRVELVTADDVGALGAIRRMGCELRGVERVDEMTLRFALQRTQLKKLKALAARRGESVRVLGGQGLYWALRRLARRPVLLAGMAMLLALSLILPGKILFVRAEGNVTVPTRLILEKAAQCGIVMGASGRAIRSERIKNVLLSELPQLQWVGVNVSGCVAVVSVRERAEEPQTQQAAGVTSLVAERDGVIASITVTRGTALCRAGEAVVAGQTLISGFTDCGSVTLATRAEGHIEALTRRDLTAVTPLEYASRGEVVGVTKKFSLIFGKKRINFYKGSGILDAGCAKIRTQWDLTLPGGFVLPIALVCEEWIDYSDAEAVSMPRVSLSDFAARYISAQCRGGQILHTLEATQEENGVLTLHGTYACRGELGTIREEAAQPYGKNNGADRQR